MRGFLLLRGAMRLGSDWAAAAHGHREVAARGRYVGVFQRVFGRRLGVQRVTRTRGTCVFVDFA